MKIIKEHIKEFRILFFLSIIFMGIFLIINLNAYYSYNCIVNKKINSLVEISTKNPSPDEVLNILKKENDLNNSYLSKYNFDQTLPYINSLKTNMIFAIIINMLISLLFVVIIWILLYKYLKNKDKEIDSILELIDNIINKNYALKIDSYNEGKISKIKSELYKIMISFKEISENNKKAKENLSVSIADISHQIKTPLTSICIMLDNINDNPKMDENTKQDFLMEIGKQLEIIKFLSIALLKLARFDAGVVEFKKETINLKRLLNEVCDKLSIFYENKNVNIEIKCENNCFFIGDYKWEVEALSNIIKNCIEASNNGDTINIVGESNTLFTKIVIKDQGKGIPKNDIRHIFERFYKSKNSTKDSFGIGLNLSKNIIENDSGYIFVESEENKGATFTIKYTK